MKASNKKMKKLQICCQKKEVFNFSDNSGNKLYRAHVHWVDICCVIIIDHIFTNKSLLEQLQLSFAKQYRGIKFLKNLRVIA